MRAVASRRARGRDRRGAERPRRREARARGGVRGDGLRGERRPRRAVARRGGAQRRLARDAHEHEPRDDRVLRLPGAARPPGAPRSDAGARVPPGLRRAVRRDPADPARLARARGPGRLDRGRRAVRRRRRRLRPLPPASAPPRCGDVHRGGPALVRLPRRGGAPRPRHARRRQRDQRARDRVRPRTGRAGRVVLPQAAVRDPEDRRRRPLGLAVVHALRRARAASRRPGRARAEAARPDPACRGLAGRLRRARTRPGHLRRGHRALPGLPRAGRGRQHHVSARDRRDRRPHRHVRRRERRELRRDRLRDGLRPRRSLPRRRGSPGARARARPRAPNAPPRPPRSRRPRAVPGPGPLLPAPRAPGEVAGRRLVRRRRAARRRRPPPCARRARPAARGAQRARGDAGRAGGRGPDLEARPELAEPLLFGPMLPPRYRLDGPGAQAEAEARFREQLAASPRAPVDPAHLAELRAFGLASVADALGV